MKEEQAERLRPVGRGTPMGELLRRYWLPIAVASEVTEEKPTRWLRILAENLVLYRNRSGRLGLIQDTCPHQGASLTYGRPTKLGLACAVHGWSFDPEGISYNNYEEDLRVTAYPVREYAGLCWAYLGPPPAPELTRYAVLERAHYSWGTPPGPRGRLRITVYPQLGCNWFQAGRFGLDPWILRESAGGVGLVPARGLGTAQGPPLRDEDAGTTLAGVGPLLPAHLAMGTLWLRMPIDHNQTWMVSVDFIPEQQGAVLRKAQDERTGGADLEPEVVHLRSQERSGEVDWNARHSFYEPWAAAGGGIDLLHEMLLREVARVERGEDPTGVIRDPDHSVIPTGLI